MRSSARLVVLLLASVASPGVARAHNARVHRDMTDRAYHVLLALSAGRIETAGDPDLAELAAAAGGAVRKLQALPAGL